MTFHDLVPGVGDVLDALAGMAGDGWLLIEAALADQDARTVQQAGRILSRAPSRLPRLARLFAAARGNSFGVQVAVVRIVGTLPKPSAVGLAIIARAVGAADVDLRLAGAWALAAGAPLPAFAHRLVREAGHDRDPRVQLYAAVGAVKCGDELLQSEGRALIHGVTRGSEVRLQIALLECMDGMPSLVGLLTGELAELLYSDADIDRVAGDWGPDGMRWWVGETPGEKPGWNGGSTPSGDGDR